MAVYPAKTQISLGIRPVWSESLLSAWRKLGSFAIHWAYSDDRSDWADAQAGLSLRWAHTHFVGFVMSRLTYTVSTFVSTDYREDIIRTLSNKQLTSPKYSSCCQLKCMGHDHASTYTNILPGNDRFSKIVCFSIIIIYWIYIVKYSARVHVARDARACRIFNNINSITYKFKSLLEISLYKINAKCCSCLNCRSAKISVCVGETPARVIPNKRRHTGIPVFIIFS